MKEIKLSQIRGTKYAHLDLVALVDDDDYVYLSQFNWHAAKSDLFYAVTTSLGGHIRMHRLILGLKPFDRKMVDHRDRNGLNNQRSNIRICSNAENQKNKQPSGTSKYLGVCWHTTKRTYFRKKTNDWVTYISSSWKSSIKAGDKYKHLGRFENEIDAAKAYNEAAIKYHGEFANLNDV